PFELWDALGVSETAEAMRKYGLDVPAWRAAVPAAVIGRPARSPEIVRENKGASLIDIGDGVLQLEFHTKMNTLEADVRNLIVQSVEKLEKGAWAGMVIGNDGASFCVGANLAAGFGSNGSEAINRGVKA